LLDWLAGAFNIEAVGEGVEVEQQNRMRSLTAEKIQRSPAWRAAVSAAAKARWAKAKKAGKTRW
jgi:hypothetical protein